MDSTIEFPLVGTTLLSGLLCALCCALLHALFKSGDATTGVENALLTGVERMANRADFDEERTALDSRTSCEGLTTTAGDLGLHICGMDLWLHIIPSRWVLWLRSEAIGEPAMRFLEGVSRGGDYPANWVILKSCLYLNLLDLILSGWSDGGLLDLHQEFDVGLGALHLLEQEFECLL
jgi:hypothetical protein